MNVTHFSKHKRETVLVRAPFDFVRSARVLLLWGLAQALKNGLAQNFKKGNYHLALCFHWVHWACSAQPKPACWGMNAGPWETHTCTYRCTQRIPGAWQASCTAGRYLTSYNWSWAIIYQEQKPVLTRSSLQSKGSYTQGPLGLPLTDTHSLTRLRGRGSAFNPKTHVFIK